VGREPEICFSLGTLGVFYPMKDDHSRTSDVSVDEERVKVTKQVDLANNVQARYASSAHRRKRCLIANEGSKILFEISLGLRC
jgi:hypothetical protein